MADAQVVPPPPRLTGDYANDFPSIVAYLNDLYSINRSGATTEVPDITDLPDPASTTLAKAQQTANQAYVLAAQADGKAVDAAEAAAEALVVTDRIETWLEGTITFSDTETSKIIVFTDPLPDANFTIVFTPSDFAGAPGPDARTITKQVNTVDDCTIDILAAPGAGTSVSFHWHLRR